MSLVRTLMLRDGSEVGALVRSWTDATLEPEPVTQTASSVMSQMMTGGHKVTTRVVTRGGG